MTAWLRLILTLPPRYDGRMVGWRDGWMHGWKDHVHTTKAQMKAGASLAFGPMVSPTVSTQPQAEQRAVEAGK